MNTEIEFAHVGIQKTGSTWLQYGLFDQHPQLEVFGHLLKGHRLEKLGYLVRGLYAVDFDQNGWLAAFREQAAQLRANRTVGISNEQLAGHVFDAAGGLIVAKRLRRALGDIKIILVLRNPLEFIQSGHAQAIKSGTMTMDLQSLLGDPGWQGRIAARVDYMALVDSFSSRFSQVLVLPYELLRDDAQEFLDRICSFLGIERFHATHNRGTNPRIPVLLQEVMRRTNAIDLKLWPRGRYVSRALKHSAPVMKWLSREPEALTMARMRQLGYVCFDPEHYRIWNGELAGYNYFQSELNPITRA